MNNRSWSRLLIEALEEDVEFQSRGFTAQFGPVGGVLVRRAEHVRGVWNSRADRYLWTGAGYREPNFATASVADAVSYTLAEVLRT